MKNGSLKLELKDGEITALSVCSGLEAAHKRLFISARDGALNSPDNVDLGIQVIIFGCFWVEACCNELLASLIDILVQPKRFGRAVWEVNRRSDIRDKFKMLAALSRAEQSSECQEVLSTLNKAIEVRNRLAHAKEADQKIVIAENYETYADNLASNLGLLSDHPLVDELILPTINNHASAIEKAQEWMHKIKTEYISQTTFNLE